MTLCDARPPVPTTAPEGFHYEAVEQDGEWIVPPIGAGRCRYGCGGGRKACGKPAAATLMRNRWGKAGPSKAPWDYCAEHLYGRWIEDAKVMGWRLVRHDDGDTGSDLAGRYGVSGDA